MNYDKLETEFNQLNGREQWEWVLKNKDLKPIITLDNDNTTGWKENPTDSENGAYLDFKSDIGNRHGLIDLLSIIGLNPEFC